MRPRNRKDDVVLNEKAYVALRDDIISGRLRDGTALVESRLSEILQIGRVPLREAIRRLAEQGYVQLMPYRSAVVKGLCKEDIENIYTVLAVLEGLAMRLAVPKMTDAHVAHLVELSAGMMAAEGRDDYMEFLNLNESFHSLSWELCMNKHLIDTISLFRNKLKRYQYMIAYKKGISQYLKDHTSIVEAVVAKDPFGAEIAMAKHIENVKSIRQEFFRDFPLVISDGHFD